MRGLRMSLITTMVLALLCAAAFSVASAQEEAEPMPAPVPGEPFAAVLSGSLTFELLEAPTEECPMGVRTITDATGPTTVGDVTLHSEHCPTFELPTVPVGETTLTTADGDEISGVYFVDCDPLMPSAESGESITCLGRLEFTGGTGKFSEATGSANWVAFAWFPGSLEVQGWPWISKMEGSLSY